MKRQTFNRLIAAANFAELFISEMAWNNPTGPVKLPPIEIDAVTYCPQAVAEKCGFKVLVCEVGTIPTTSVCRRIDLKVRRFANDYILIFVQCSGFHHLWLAPVRKVDKRDIVTTEYTTAAQSEFLFEKVDKLAFAFDERVTITDVRQRVQESFVVNSEKITKDFYAGFKKEHKAFVEFISGIDCTDTATKDRQWYASVMLNRLMFCYFIQKKGFLDGNTDYLQDKLRLVQRERGDGHFFRSFYIGFLRGLFHDGLNTPRHDEEFENTYGRIPYLNGGMFDEHKIEHDYTDIDIADEAFERLFNFFDRWNWHLDTRITASGKDINPDVLGYIFEQYINDRAQMGAYYTKEDITEYIGRNCILPFLFDAVKNATKESARDFAPDGFVWQMLSNSGDRYIFDAVRHGVDTFDDIPENIRRGIITEAMRHEYAETPVGELPDNHIPLAELRKDWNSRTPEQWGLPTEIWRESIDRMQRALAIRQKIENGEITSINDFITYNLDIRSFAHDLLAGAADHLFVKHFYQALKDVTILDPTCGSGAFLFAAMNILEPLYEICIDRMQEFNAKNPKLFKDELAEITDKYRSNIQYFIFKSIILRNLYGVDIMVEATEIAKLRLFLKMVAVVDVDRRADNLGLDPLPDIDFNIRCGNTLIGYANKEQLTRDLNDGQGSLAIGEANRMLKESIEEEMQKVASTYKLFKEVQLKQEEDMLAFKQAKHLLRERLIALNDKLNRRLYLGTNGMNVPDGVDFTLTKEYKDWLTSHQPFHWLAEYYQIIEGNKGFDVIIGNPPYVVYSASNVSYSVQNFVTSKARNLYAFCIERALSLINNNSYFSMIVPISLSNGANYRIVRDLLYKRGTTYYSHYAGDSHPSCLFTGVQQNLTIFISSPNNNNIFTTNYIKFYTEERCTLYSVIMYCDVDNANEYIIRYGNLLSQKICEKVKAKEKISRWLTSAGPNKMFFKNTSGAAYKPFFSEPPFFEVNNSPVSSKTMDCLSFRTKSQVTSCIALFNSNLFNFLFYLVSDARHITPRETLELIHIDDLLENDRELHRLSKKLENDYSHNSVIVVYNKKNGITKYAQFNPRLSKRIMDEIDTVLARHYGFTNEELDFIINYDIKYRMGDELNSTEE